MANPSKKKNKRLNEQVKRNKERFPDDFMFQLTHEEWNVLQSQFATTKDLSKIRTLPYVFTRNGIGMLSSVLGSSNEYSIWNSTNRRRMRKSIILLPKWTIKKQTITKYISVLHTLYTYIYRQAFRNYDNFT